MNNDDAKAAADLTCFLQSCNPPMAKEFLGICVFRDAVLASNLAAPAVEGDEHSMYFLAALQKEGILMTGWSLCQCGQCWATILKAPNQGKKIQRILFETAFTCCKRPPPPMDRLLTLPISPPPAVEYLKDYVSLARRYKAFPEFKCARMVHEGNQRGTT